MQFAAFEKFVLVFICELGLIWGCKVKSNSGKLIFLHVWTRTDLTMFWTIMVLNGVSLLITRFIYKLFDLHRAEEVDPNLFLIFKFCFNMEQEEHLILKKCKKNLPCAIFIGFVFLVHKKIPLPSLIHVSAHDSQVLEFYRSSYRSLFIF